jgi:hypothetical protein
MITDLSDEGLVARFGDILFEIPELIEALRIAELQSRPAVNAGGFACRSREISMQRVGDGFVARIGSGRH